VIAVAQRPEGDNPLGVKNLDPHWICRLGRSGRDGYDALIGMDLGALGAPMNECMRCWEAILPHTVSHPAIHVDLKGLLGYYSRAIRAPCIPDAAAAISTWRHGNRSRGRSTFR
jgi:hypothetical protein